MTNQELQPEKHGKATDGGWVLLLFAVLFLGVILLGVLMI